MSNSSEIYIFPENFSSRKFHWTLLVLSPLRWGNNDPSRYGSSIDAKFSRTISRKTQDSRGTRGGIGSKDLSYIIPKSGKLVHVDRS